MNRWTFTRWHYRKWKRARRRALFRMTVGGCGVHNIYSLIARDPLVIYPRNAGKN